jgi:ubiquinone/menaquinone biosynthesis C-methylase UbiE
MTSEWLVQDSRSHLSDYIAMWNDLAFPFWDQNLEKTIIEGKPPRSFYGWINEQGKSSSHCFQNGMLDLSRLIANEIVNKATIPSNARSLLDVGGGHGLYTLKFCQKYHHLKATIVDFPSSLETSNKLAAIEKMTDRISFHPANYLTDPLGHDMHDIALLFNVIHAHSSEENIELLRKVGNSLRAGGRVMILELVSDDATLKKMPSIINFFNLAFLASFGTQMCSTIEVEKCLSAAGLYVIKRKSLIRIPGLRLVIGRKE